ncbi:MAG TPA: HAMP domain-containing sensor histidine kinase [Cyanophyceae cyanobacterium]
MNLIYLVVGVGLGVLGSRIAHSLKQPLKQPEVPTTSTSPAKEPDTLQPLQEDLKEELKQAQLAYQMATQMSQFKAGFLARTSHELRSPLSSLIGMHQIILSDLCDSPEEARDFVAQANTSALKMVKLLDELIAVAKTEHGTNRLDIYPLQLTQVLQDVHQLTHLQAANRNLQLEVILPDSDLYVLADPRRFRQALAGIVDSAIAQMQEGSIKVWAASVPDSKEAHIWITIQSPSPVWSEPIDLLYTKPEQQKQPGEAAELSPGLILLMAQTLIEVMHGRLELLPVSAQETTDDSADNLTRLQCSMPLGTPETVEQALVQE